MENTAKHKITLETEGRTSWFTPDRDVSEWRNVDEKIFTFIGELLIKSAQLSADMNEALAERLLNASNGVSQEKGRGQHTSAPSDLVGEETARYGEASNQKRFLNRDEAAKRIGVKPDRVTDIAREGRIKRYTNPDGTSLYSVSELDEYRRNTKPRGIVKGSRLLNSSEAAKRLGVSTSYIETMALNGRIVAKPVNDGFLFDRKAIDEWAQKYNQTMDSVLELR